MERAYRSLTVYSNLAQYTIDNTAELIFSIAASWGFKNKKK